MSSHGDAHARLAAHLAVLLTHRARTLDALEAIQQREQCLAALTLALQATAQSGQQVLARLQGDFERSVAESGAAESAAAAKTQSAAAAVPVESAAAGAAAAGATEKAAGDLDEPEDVDLFPGAPARGEASGGGESSARGGPGDDDEGGEDWDDFGDDEDEDEDPRGSATAKGRQDDDDAAAAAGLAAAASAAERSGFEALAALAATTLETVMAREANEQKRGPQRWF